VGFTGSNETSGPDGSTVATITEVGGFDQVWYNSGDNRYYLAARGMTSNGLKSGTPTPVLGVIDAEDNTWITKHPDGPQRALSRGEPPQQPHLRPAPREGGSRLRAQQGQRGLSSEGVQGAAGVSRGRIERR
jgi:hypothetical protein